MWTRSRNGVSLCCVNGACLCENKTLVALHIFLQVVDWSRSRELLSRLDLPGNNRRKRNSHRLPILGHRRAQHTLFQMCIDRARLYSEHTLGFLPVAVYAMGGSQRLLQRLLKVPSSRVLQVAVEFRSFRELASFDHCPCLFPDTTEPVDKSTARRHKHLYHELWEMR